MAVNAGRMAVQCCRLSVDLNPNTKTVKAVSLQFREVRPKKQGYSWKHRLNSNRTLEQPRVEPVRCQLTGCLSLGIAKACLTLDATETCNSQQGQYSILHRTYTMVHRSYIIKQPTRRKNIPRLSRDSFTDHTQPTMNQVCCSQRRSWLCRQRAPRAQFCGFPRQYPTVERYHGTNVCCTWVEVETRSNFDSLHAFLP